jgi:hypothetical protein
VSGTTQGKRGLLALPRGRADLRNHGAAYRFSCRRSAARWALLGCARRLTAERNGPNVLADERLPFGALAEVDLQPRKLSQSVVLIGLSPRDSCRTFLAGEIRARSIRRRLCWKTISAANWSPQTTAGAAGGHGSARYRLPLLAARPPHRGSGSWSRPAPALANTDPRGQSGHGLGPINAGVKRSRSIDGAPLIGPARFWFGSLRGGAGLAEAS